MIGPFPFVDRRDRLFGRAPDVRELRSRAARKGLTVVIGRPKLGKTWLLQEAGRHLSEDLGFLVGYHECKAESPDLLLRAVSDLYVRWLSDAGNWEQARSLWQRHKGELVTAAGLAFGRIVAAVGNLDGGPAGKIGGAVKDSFNALVAADRDLKTGGQELRTLSYDRALELMQVVSVVSGGKPLALFLDAWEKSPSLKFEHRILESFLDHLDDWPECHVFAGVRQPEIDGSKRDDRALRLAQDLEGASAAARIYFLPPMHLEEGEAGRLLDFVRSQIPAAAEVDSRVLTKLVDRFPGVVDRWTSESLREELETVEDLESAADDAQAYRYREFNGLFPDLAAEERHTAIRLAVLPRMDASSWPDFRQMVLGDAGESLIDELIVKHVLEPGSAVPSYGHDTRHQAARNWFADRREYKAMLRRYAEELIGKMASRFERADESFQPFAAALRAVGDWIDRDSLSRASRSLLASATLLFDDTEPELRAALELGAMGTLRSHPSSVGLLAQALVNRGVIKAQIDDSESEMADFDTVLEMSDAPTEQKAQALVNRGVTKGEFGDFEGAITDYDAVLEMTDAPPGQKAQALNYRGFTKDKLGDFDSAVLDFGDVLEMTDAPHDQKAQALVNRGVIKGKHGDFGGAMADYGTVLEMTEAPPIRKAQALVNRGIGKGRLGEFDVAMADFNTVLGMPDAPTDQKAQALVNRGIIKGRLKNFEGAMADFDSILEMTEAPPDQKAQALNYRGVTKGQLGDSEGAMADYDAILEVPDAPPDLKAKALLDRGVSKGQLGDSEGATADYDAVLQTPDAGEEARAQALGGRGYILAANGDPSGCGDLRKARDLAAGLGMQDLLDSVSAALAKLCGEH